MVDIGTNKIVDFFSLLSGEVKLCLSSEVANVQDKRCSRMSPSRYFGIRMSSKNFLRVWVDNENAFRINSQENFLWEVAVHLRFNEEKA